MAEQDRTGRFGATRKEKAYLALIAVVLALIVAMLLIYPRTRSDDVESIAVHTARSERFRRLVRRDREDAPHSEAEFDERDSREIGWGIAEVIALSEHMIVNDSDLETFREQARGLLERLR